jgi:hypothetical protein
MGSTWQEEEILTVRYLEEDCGGENERDGQDLE